MSKHTTNRPVRNAARKRAAVLVAGFGASVALGAGVAIAADTGQDAASQDVFAASSAQHLADSARHQADAQKATVDAAKRKAEAKKKAARDEARKQASWMKPVGAHYKLGPGMDASGSHWKHKHSGQDFAAKPGSKVLSAHQGTVVKAGGNGAGDGPGYGNAVVLKHPDGTFTQYGHMKTIKVHTGQTVKTGEQIGQVGSTGNSTGPHLHFEVRKSAEYGSAKDPVKAMKHAGVKL